MALDYLKYLLYFIVGILPCIIWLIFYLRQDMHPESNRKIIEIFILGMIIVAPVLIIENLLGNFLVKNLPTLFNVDSVSPTLVQLLFYYTIVIGFIEEFFKYIVVKLRAIKSSHFDEPIDAMLYTIIISLGLAAIENLAVIFQTTEIGSAILISVIRLLTAIFLHSLAAAITGYFLALSLSLRNKWKRFLIIISGLLLASVFHGVYDVSVVNLEKATNIFDFLFPIVIIMLMGVIVYIFFIKVKKIPRSCKA